MMVISERNSMYIRRQFDWRFFQNEMQVRCPLSQTPIDTQYPTVNGG
jgi:hypothetical protein